MILYSVELWEAAIAASYALEGRKDQDVMNRMVALSLLNSADRWTEARPKLDGKLAVNHLQAWTNTMRCHVQRSRRRRCSCGLRGISTTGHSGTTRTTRR